MEKATISQVKERLSAYLNKVRAGQTILILDRDQPVARLEPLSGASPQDDRLTRLERAGLLRRAARGPSLPALRGAALGGGTSLLAALLDDRRTGR